MSSYSSSDINDAKRRVEEMRKRSQDYIAPSEKSKTTSSPPESKQNFASNPISDLLNGIFSGSDSGDGSKGLILALILILSKEGADHSLILALLYILL